MLILSRLQGVVSYYQPRTFVLNEKLVTTHSNLLQSLGNRLLSPTRFFLNGSLPKEEGSTLEKIRRIACLAGLLVTAPFSLGGIFLNAAGRRVNPCGVLPDQAVRDQNALEGFSRDADMKALFIVNQWLSLYQDAQHWVSKAPAFAPVFNKIERGYVERFTPLYRSALLNTHNYFVTFSEEELAAIPIESDPEEGAAPKLIGHLIRAAIELEQFQSGKEFTLDRTSSNLLVERLEFHSRNLGSFCATLGQTVGLTDEEKRGLNEIEERRQELEELSTFYGELGLKEELSKSYEETVGSLEIISQSRSRVFRPIEVLQHSLKVATQPSFTTSQGEEVAYHFNTLESMGNRCFKISQFFANLYPEGEGSLLQHMKGVVVLVALVVTAPLCMLGWLFQKVGESYNPCGRLRKELLQHHENSGLELKRDEKRIGTLVHQSKTLGEELQRWLGRSKIYLPFFQEMEFCFLNGESSSAKVASITAQWSVPQELEDALISYYKSFANIQREGEASWDNLDYWTNGTSFVEGDPSQPPNFDQTRFYRSVGFVEEMKKQTIALLNALKGIPFLKNGQRKALSNFSDAADRLGWFERQGGGASALVGLKEKYKEKNSKSIGEYNKILSQMKEINAVVPKKKYSVYQAIKVDLATHAETVFDSSIGSASYDYNRFEVIGHKLLVPGAFFFKQTAHLSPLYSAAGWVMFIAFFPITLLGRLLQKIGEGRNPRFSLHEEILHHHQAAIHLLCPAEDKVSSADLQVTLLTSKIQRWAERLGYHDPFFKAVRQYWSAEAATPSGSSMDVDAPQPRALLESPLKKGIADGVLEAASNVSRSDLAAKKSRLLALNKGDPFEVEPLSKWAEATLLSIEKNQVFLKEINKFKLDSDQKKRLLQFTKQLLKLKKEVKATTEAVNLASTNLLPRIKCNYEKSVWNLIKISNMN